MIDIPSLALEDARAMIAAGKAHAAGLGVPSTLCVVDAAGAVIAQERMDGAALSSLGLAGDKAYTALALRMPTRAVGEIAKPGDPFFGIANGLGGRAIVFPGGLPLTHGGRVVGAVGASGGSGDQDEEVARAAAAAFQGDSQ